MATHPEVYWTALKRSSFVLNWWMTRQYVELARLKWTEKDGLVGWMDDKTDGEWFLPPYELEEKNHETWLGGFRLDQPVFAGFPGWSGPNEVRTFLDHQYIYDAHDFLNLEGKQWEVFRKNIRKYPRRFASADDDSQLVYRELQPLEMQENVAALMESWAGDRTLHDVETFVRFVLFSAFRWGLFLNGVLVGLNVGDLNSSGAIFRYCIDDGTPYLNEYLRYRFFMSKWVQDRRWVNDGGDLGDPGLSKFKMRLNPAAVFDVYSYSKREET